MKTAPATRGNRPGYLICKRKVCLQIEMAVVVDVGSLQIEMAVVVNPWRMCRWLYIVVV